ncbi:MAG: carboxy-S-adenosyl-L-methionine synthase CmoA [Desulfobacterales bacterium]|nr:MAG: carboxy-S-adenosyl-L-methionine synthase CmoA [Desulfobacterales bacterium]
MHEAARDKLFAVDRVEEDFDFNHRVAEVFDDMLDRSVPCYRQVIQASAELLGRFVKPGDVVYDLGCSTGTSLLEYARLLQDRQLQFIGVDNSAAMLEKAQLKAELHGKGETISFLLEDITHFNQPGAGAIILHYTLQFIRPLLREAFIQGLYQSLRPGGLLLVSEKVLSHHGRINRVYIDVYHDFKRSKGYSELEIAKKREALENILIPFSIEENRDLLKRCGFTSVETYFQWFNFASFAALKSE